MVMDKDYGVEFSREKANEGAASRDGQSSVAKTVKRKFEPYVDTDDEDDQPLCFRKPLASMVAKPAAGGANSLAAGATAKESGMTGFVSGDKRQLLKRRPLLKFRINMETDMTIANQAQRQMSEAASTVSDLCTGFEISKIKNEELRKQVIDLEGQIQKWKGQKSRWDALKKDLERDCDEVRKEAVKVVAEKRNLEEKLEKAVKKAEDAKVFAKKAIEEAANKAVGEKRDLEVKLEKAVKHAEDIKAAAKIAIHEAVASTKKCYKIGLGNFVAYLATGEGRSLGDYVNELFKEIPRVVSPPADGEVYMAGHKGDRAIKDETP